MLPIGNSGDLYLEKRGIWCNLIAATAIMQGIIAELSFSYRRTRHQISEELSLRVFIFWR
jgi:hypothetical protein